MTQKKWRCRIHDTPFRFVFGKMENGAIETALATVVLEEYRKANTYLTKLRLPFPDSRKTTEKKILETVREGPAWSGRKAQQRAGPGET